MSEATLAYTVHHQGRKYSAGSTAAQIGPAAAEIGDHAWVGGRRPSNVPQPGDPEGGTMLGSPPAAMSPLGSPAPTPEPPASEPPEGGDQGDAETGTSADREAAPRRGTRRSNSNT